MTSDDLHALTEILTRHPELSDFEFIGPSAGEWEVALIKNIYDKNLYPVPQSDWNLLEEPHARIKPAVFMLCNTFMYSTDPELWLKNLGKVARYLIIQDLCTATRLTGRITAPFHLGGDGDVQRYSVSSHGVIGRTDPDVRPVFDFSTCGAKVVDCLPYRQREDGSYGNFVVILDLGGSSESRTHDGV